MNIYMRSGKVVRNGAGRTLGKPSSLPAWVANAPNRGDWYEIPSSSMSSHPPSVIQSPAYEGPSAIFDDWNGFAMDRLTSKVYAPGLGGHHGYAGNEVMMFDPNLASPRWFELIPGTISANVTEATRYYADGKPTS